MEPIAVWCAFDEMVALESLIENPRNPNRHPDSQVRTLATVIEAQGWRAPITVSRRSGMVVRGHGRLAAARLLEQDEVPVDWQEYESDEAEWADLIADNYLAQLAETDTLVLRDVLEELDTGAFDVSLTGYDEKALESLLCNYGDIPLDAEPPDGGERTVTCPECGHEWNPSERREA